MAKATDSVILSLSLMFSLLSCISSMLAAAILRIVFADRPLVNSGSKESLVIPLRIALPLATLSGSNLSFSLALFDPALADNTSSKSATRAKAAFFCSALALFKVSRAICAFFDSSSEITLPLSWRASLTWMSVLRPITPER